MGPRSSPSAQPNLGSGPRLCTLCIPRPRRGDVGFLLVSMSSFHILLRHQKAPNNSLDTMGKHATRHQAFDPKESLVLLNVVRALQLYNWEPSLLRVKQHVWDQVKMLQLS